MATDFSPSFYNYEYTFLTLFLLEFIIAVSFVFAMCLWVCCWDYVSGIVVQEWFFFAGGWRLIPVNPYRVPFGSSGLAGYPGIWFHSLMRWDFACQCK